MGPSVACTAPATGAPQFSSVRRLMSTLLVLVLCCCCCSNAAAFIRKKGGSKGAQVDVGDVVGSGGNGNAGAPVLKLRREAKKALAQWATAATKSRNTTSLRAVTAIGSLVVDGMQGGPMKKAKEALARADAEPADVSVVLETLPLAALVSMPEMDLDGSGDLSKEELADAIRLHERRQLEGAAGARPTGGLRSGLAILLTTLLVMVPCASPDPLSRQLRRKYRGYREASRAHAQQRAWRVELGLADARGVLTGDQVRKSFRRRSRSCHPDRNRDDPAASKQWHLLKEARDGLLEAMPT
mmetsp:Transcript_3844/g.8270  ORF Transcript_3844/g.8270 Transcript_3844/m.8270 type:complete len:299 (-) Transcript_3844:144-1040(-)|eukprot:CAMPEP_0119468054 /NCGR_PEP_ID=MMETSP1344-20130328/1980_1 /TAXON_ID=236787 /ORGANISM="Florenciella parvula, Strain CCMP2471" /LENGTH=298 /DNA_ID=CAMNT_0007500489 /DNA_START=47 /DNA_END=946 /DNA_ORIENTATION=+